MKQSMIIHLNDGYKEHNICPSCKIDYLNDHIPDDETVPLFYSERNAHDAGWRRTTHHLFSDNGKPVWVCPECWPGDVP